jgi:hypothetical protein
MQAHHRTHPAAEVHACSSISLPRNRDRLLSDTCNFARSGKTPMPRTARLPASFNCALEGCAHGNPSVFKLKSLCNSSRNSS